MTFIEWIETNPQLWGYDIFHNCLAYSPYQVKDALNRSGLTDAIYKDGIKLIEKHYYGAPRLILSSAAQLKIIEHDFRQLLPEELLSALITRIPYIFYSYHVDCFGITQSSAKWRNVRAAATNLLNALEEAGFQHEFNITEEEVWEKCNNLKITNLSPLTSQAAQAQLSLHGFLSGFIDVHDEHFLGKKPYIQFATPRKNKSLNFKGYILRWLRQEIDERMVEKASTKYGLNTLVAKIATVILAEQISPNAVSQAIRASDIDHRAYHCE